MEVIWDLTPRSDFAGTVLDDQRSDFKNFKCKSLENYLIETLVLTVSQFTYNAKFGTVGRANTTVFGRLCIFFGGSSYLV